MKVCGTLRLKEKVLVYKGGLMVHSTLASGSMTKQTAKDSSCTLMVTSMLVNGLMKRPKAKGATATAMAPNM